MEKKLKIRLQGHEKFLLREGWLTKGIFRVHDNPAVFLSKEAPDEFGVGNNMVKSIRFWLRAFNLIDSRTGELTQLGQLIYEYDPYFEDDFTLWIMHSNIVKNCTEATSWYLFFNNCDAEDLDREQVFNLLKRELVKYTGETLFSEKSLKSDVDVILGMYTNNRFIGDPEDKNISPFSRLGLIRSDSGKYSKNRIDRRLFSEWIVLYEVVERLTDRKSISIDEVFCGENGMAAIYQIDEIMINDYLDKLDSMGYIRLDRTAGLDMIYALNETTKYEVLSAYYNNGRQEII